MLINFNTDIPNFNDIIINKISIQRQIHKLLNNNRGGAITTNI